MSLSDKLSGDGIAVGNAAWNFSGKAAECFPEHVRRSIPFYEIGHDMVCKLSDFFVKPGSLVYELGTSRGELLIALADRNVQRLGCQFVGLDREPDMVQRAQEAVCERDNVLIQEDDIILCDFADADLIVSYYCIQFISPKHRQDVITKVYQALNWGGGFIWFEKVRGPDARFQDMQTALYDEYKLAQGYTPVEIMNKARSLKGVLEPFSTQGNLDLLARAGFVDVMCIFRYMCFEGLLAIK